MATEIQLKITRDERIWKEIHCVYKNVTQAIFCKSLHFNGNFPGGPELAGTRISLFWILLELKMMEVVNGDNWYAGRSGLKVAVVSEMTYTVSSGTLNPSIPGRYTRSQWSSGSMSDCSARGPGIESRCGQLCLSYNHCDLQPWARAVCTLPTVPRSTQPSTLCGTVNEYQLSGWVIIINGDGGCRR